MDDTYRSRSVVSFLDRSKAGVLREVVVFCVTFVVLATCGMHTTWHRFRTPAPRCLPGWYKTLLSGTTRKRDVWVLSRTLRCMEVLFLPGFTGTRRSSPEQHESVTFASAKRAVRHVCTPCRAVKWHEVSLVHDTSLQRNSNTIVYVGVTISALCGPVGVLVGFEATKFLSAWSRTFDREGLAGYALESNMIAFIAATRLCTLVSPSLPCASCRRVDRIWFRAAHRTLKHVTPMESSTAFSVITVMASVGEFASWRPKRGQACGVTMSGTTIVVVELWLLFSRATV